MAITISGSPQVLTAGYNPVYFYASSDNITEPDFRYLVDVYNVDTNTQLANLKIKPRFGDDLLEVNINKILQSNLSSVIDDDNNVGIGLFNPINNTNSSGFKYRVDIGEEYTDNWEFTGVFSAVTGNLLLLSSSASPSSYSIGDVIFVSGAADELEYSGITMSPSGYTTFLLTSPQSFTVGDPVSVYQTSPYQYPLYNGAFNITSESTSTSLVVNLLFQGASSLVQSGTIIRNGYLNGAAVVLSAATVGPFYYLVLDKPVVTPNINNALTGSTRYADSRVSSFPGLISQTKAVFNGAISYASWPYWDPAPYNITATDQQFLTTLPDTWTVREENDIYLNLFTNNSGSTYAGILEIKTYDCNDVLLSTTQIPNQLATQSTVQMFSVGPASLNETNVLLPSIITNGTFTGATGWVITNILTGTAAISGGTLNYIDYVGDGTSLVVQASALTSGTTYTVTLTTNSNNFVIVSVGDENDLYPIATQGQNGTYSYVFTATGTDFYIDISSAGGVTQGVIIDNLLVQPTITGDIINCDEVCYYTARVLTNGGGNRSELKTFILDCSCNYKYTNYPLSFMDRMGSYVSFNFSLNNRQKVDIKREHFNRFVGGLSVGSPNGYNYLLSKSGDRTYSVLLDEKWELNTDWLTEAESLYFEELMTSPNVFLKYNDDYHAVNITDSSYERIRKNNKKMIQYTVNIAFANNNTVQTG